MIRSISSLPDGRRLAWVGAGSGPPLVLLHGWSMSAAAFAEVMPLLAEDFRVLAPDLPGHGASDAPREVTFEALAADLAAWIRVWADFDPVHLAGWSLGGMLAMEIVSRKLVPVDRLILLGTTPRFTAAPDWLCGLPATQVRALARNLARRFEATLGEFFALAFAGEEVSRERLSAIRRITVHPGGLPDRATAAALLGLLEIQDQRHLLTAIDRPALVLHGETDAITPAAAGRLLAEQLPQGIYMEFPGVGHAPLLSRPHEVVERTWEFLQWGR